MTDKALRLLLRYVLFNSLTSCQIGRRFFREVPLAAVSGVRPCHRNCHRRHAGCILNKDMIY